MNKRRNDFDILLLITTDQIGLIGIHISQKRDLLQNYRKKLIEIYQHKNCHPTTCHKHDN